MIKKPRRRRRCDGAGTCHAVLQESSEQSAQDDYKPVPCSGAHKAETVAVFDLTAKR